MLWILAFLVLPLVVASVYAGLFHVLGYAVEKLRADSKLHYFSCVLLWELQRGGEKVLIWTIFVAYLLLGFTFFGVVLC